ncbi:MAG TPA: helix-turn-helix domain-containing protein [Actinomycetes bacterium]
MTDPRAHRVLAGVSRVAVLEALRSAGRPLSVQEVADEVGLHPNTVRAHLDLLVDHGHASRAAEQRTTPGRPRLVYAATGKPDEDEGRNYRLLAEILTRYLAAASPSPAAAAVEAGRAFGRGLAGDGTARDETAAVDRLVELLDAVGFAPEPAPDGVSIRLHHCPFRELAEERQDLVCSVHLGLMQGALAELDAPVSATRLLPFVEPELCVATLGTTED